MLHHVVFKMFSAVLKERIALIFSGEECVKEATSGLRSLCLHISVLIFSSTLKMEIISSSETSLKFCRATQRHIPRDSTLHFQPYKNIKYDTEIFNEYVFIAYVIGTRHIRNARKMHYSCAHRRLQETVTVSPTMTKSHI